MVSRKTSQRKTVKKRRSHSKTIWRVAGCLLIVACVVSVIIIVHKINESSDQTLEPTQQELEPSEPEPAETLPDRIDFQPIIDKWVRSTSGNKSVLVYDLDRDEVVGSYNPNEIYNTASLYKLFVVYDGYRKLQTGEWDSSARAGVTGHTILKCLDLSIRESNSECAETIWDMIGREKLDEIIASDYKITDSDISSLLATPHDIMEMLKIFYDHRDISDQNLIGAMKDSFLNQPTTEYNWRQGLPSGFNTARVYNKVGWDYNPRGYWNIYHDAAIVEFPDADRHFIVVVMTNQVPYQRIAEFGTAIENAFYGD